MAMLLLSGGVDSAVLLAKLVADGFTPRCVSFNYGQRHKKELLSARAIASYYIVPYEEVDLPHFVFSRSVLTGQSPVPHARYDDPSQKVTVVPNRNLVFLSVAAALAIQHKMYHVFFAAHADDAVIYPDCRKEFVESANTTFKLACGVSIQAPFLSLQKSEVVTIGKKLGCPLHLTWSCYEGKDVPCGKCGACTERQEAGA